MVDAVPANARGATDTWVKALQAYNGSINSKTRSAEDSADDLAAINSHKAFEQSDKILNVALKANQRSKNEAVVSHKDAMSNGDWKKIIGLFSDVQTTQDPVHLARCVSVLYCLKLVS